MIRKLYDKSENRIISLDITHYLDRIGFEGELAVNEKVLKELHRCHVTAVPFEAWDIQMNEPIYLDKSHIYDKVVNRRRGGYCYELNHLFYSLLTNIGFDCTMVSSRIFSKGICGPDFDHMSLIVEMEDKWLVDVGCGDLFIEPLRLEYDIVQVDRFKKFRIVEHGDGVLLLEESLIDGTDFTPKYLFDLKPREIEEFADQNTYKQTSPDSNFVKKAVCTLISDRGLKTIVNDSYKVRRSVDDTIEKRIEGRNELSEILKKEFGIYIDTGQLTLKKNA